MLFSWAHLTVINEQFVLARGLIADGTGRPSGGQPSRVNVHVQDIMSRGKTREINNPGPRAGDVGDALDNDRTLIAEAVILFVKIKVNFRRARHPGEFYGGERTVVV